jgi:ADP-heptose:LPS heptosyltransferase
MISLPAPLIGINKIAFLRANGLGDYIFALPALQSLRSAYPHAEIVLLGKPWHQDFLRGRPGPVDRVIPIPPSSGVNEPSYWETRNQSSSSDLPDFFERMQQERFDLAIQAHGGGRNSNPFLLNLKARVTAGMKTPDAPELDYWIPYRYWQHEVLRLLELVSRVGAAPAALEPSLELKPADRAEANALLGASEETLVILAPAATDPRRRWSARNFAAIGDALIKAGVRVAVTGTPPEEDVVTEVLGSMSFKAENLCGRLSLNGLAGVLAKADVVVANDSGPLHLAEAVGTAAVSIYWCGNLINAGAFTRSRHRPLLSWRLLCPVCGANTMQENCEHLSSFVDDVPVEDVLTEVTSLLQERQKARV